ncbi:glycosyltransferase family 2 protein [Aquicoccus sp. SU-CL01552]|uniref:glycosyltransferase family 2 protein n=1 Tax=Aquicoccus sp. SU-CL01552 TaxID=3127656 RepID=UPI00310482D5
MMLSVIIPCFNDHDNVSKQLDRLSNVLDHYDIEIIVIDDASTESDIDLLTPHKECFGERLVLLRNAQNMGPGPTRNVGIENAHGTYVCFLDSDDILDDAFFFYVEEIIRDHSFDVAVFKYHFQDAEDAPYSFKMSPIDETLWDRLEAHGGGGQVKALWQVPFMIMQVNYPWNKIYRRELLIRHNIRFPKLALHEDIPFHWISMMLAERLFFALEYPPLYIHNRLPGRDRATDKADSRRFQLLDASAQTLDCIASYEHLRMFYPIFLRFFFDVWGWVDGILPEGLKADFRTQAQSMCRAYYKGDVLNYLQSTDHDVAERLKEFLGDEAP